MLVLDMYGHLPWGRGIPPGEYQAVPSGDSRGSMFYLRCVWSTGSNRHQTVHNRKVHED